VSGDLIHRASVFRIVHVGADRMEEIMRNPLQENLTRRLCDSVERLQQQAEVVEFWASAVCGLTQPVPGYDPESAALAHYMKPGSPAKKRHRRVAHQNRKAGVKPASA
jgi:hypothetical protein